MPKNSDENILPEIYAKTKAKLIAELSQAKHISLTVECWTSSTTVSILTVTAHYFLENKVKLISHVIETKFLEISHTSENLQITLMGH